MKLIQNLTNEELIMRLLGQIILDQVKINPELRSSDHRQLLEEIDKRLRG